jgi:Mn2+/Fe2+ NRAMP family transporter
VHFDPIRSLFIAAVINGLLAAPVMALMMWMARSSRIMGAFTLPIYLQVVGWAGTLAMFVVSIAFLISSVK